MKSKRNYLIIPGIFVGLMFLLVACETNKSPTYPDYMPPGYKLRCDGKENFIGELPGGTQFGTYAGDKPTDREFIIKRAWKLYDIKGIPKREYYNWAICE